MLACRLESAVASVLPPLLLNLEFYASGWFRSFV
jgi:hypothetical protein